jgi:hypothetical protein
MEHSLHLVAKHFVESIAPGLSRQHSTFVTGTEGVLAEDNEGNEGDDDDNIDAADSLGKAISLVKQIRKSPQARALFCLSCSQVGIAPLELLSWIRTQWGSLFKFLKHFILLKAVCSTFLP